MVVEKFKVGSSEAIYARFGQRGRMLPDGLQYISSWVDLNKTTCFQLMATDSPELFGDWIANWSDLVDFEVMAVQTSADAARS